jgi:DNA-binding GntR family transcriptional regulator
MARLEQLRNDEIQPAIRDFHIRIAEISGNDELQRLLNGEIWHYIRTNYRRLVRSIDRRIVRPRHHEWIIDALSARDGELAEQLMRRHVRSNKQTWEEFRKL